MDLSPSEGTPQGVTPQAIRLHTDYKDATNGGLVQVTFASERNLRCLDMATGNRFNIAPAEFERRYQLASDPYKLPDGWTVVRLPGRCEVGERKRGMLPFVKVGAEILGEARAAAKNYAPFNSAHEFYGVAAEEFHEVLLALHANDREGLRKEALQLAGVCLRFVAEQDEKAAA
jgi:hypothetical protein